MIVCPLSILFAYARVAKDVLSALRREGSTLGQLEKLMGFDEFNQLVRLEEKYAAEKRYAGGR